MIQKKVLENENVLQFRNINILTLNVSGLVSKLKNPDFIEFMSLYHVICFTETKIDQYEDVEFNGFKLLPSERSLCY